MFVPPQSCSVRHCYDAVRRIFQLRMFEERRSTIHLRVQESGEIIFRHRCIVEQIALCQLLGGVLLGQHDGVTGFPCAFDLDEVG